MTHWYQHETWNFQTENFPLRALKRYFKTDALEKSRQSKSKELPKAIHSYPPVDFKTLPVDCRNFFALTEVLPCRICCGKKTVRSNFSNHAGKNVCQKL